MGGMGVQVSLRNYQVISQPIEPTIDFQIHSRNHHNYHFVISYYGITKKIRVKSIVGITLIIHPFTGQNNKFN